MVIYLGQGADLKHNTITVTCLFFYIISTNFNALSSSFVQLLFILPMKKVPHIPNDIIVTPTQVFCQQWEQTVIRGC